MSDTVLRNFFLVFGIVLIILSIVIDTYARNHEYYDGFRNKKEKILLATAFIFLCIGAGAVRTGFNF